MQALTIMGSLLTLRIGVQGVGSMQSNRLLTEISTIEYSGPKTLVMYVEILHSDLDREAMLILSNEIHLEMFSI